MKDGWFGLHRKIFKSDLWQHPTARIVFIYIRGMVNDQDFPVTLSKRYQAVTLQPGQMLTSRAEIAAKCRLSEREVRSAIKYLKSTNRVTDEATKRFTIITLTNYQTYKDAMKKNDQRNDQRNDHQVTNRRPTSDHIQEVKEYKNNPVGVADATAEKGKPKVKTFYDEHGIPYPVLPSRPPDPEAPHLNDQAEEAEERR